MNAKADDAVFPLIFTGDPNQQCYGVGISKRELFSGMAMQGLLSTELGTNSSAKWIAQKAVERADALIAALNESTETQS